MKEVFEPLRAPISLASAAVAALLVCGPVSAQSGSFAEFKSGKWVGGAYLGSDGEFSHCVVSAIYNNGITLLVTVTRDYLVGLALRNDKWDLPSGSSYKIPLSVDGQVLGSFPAEALDRRLLMIDLDPEGKVFRSLRRGRQLLVGAERQDFSFGLEGSAQALSKTVQCVDRARDVAKNDKNPFVSREGDQVTEGSNPFAKAAPVRAAFDLKNKDLIRDLMRLGGVEELRFIDPRASRFHEAEYAWVTDDFDGVILEFREEDAGLYAASRKTLVRLASTCRGDFATKTPPPEIYPKMNLQLFSVACVEAEEDTQYFFAATVIDYKGLVSLIVNRTYTEPEQLQALNHAIAEWFRDEMSD